VVIKSEIKDELRRELATKQDIAVLEQKIEIVRQELKGEIKVLKILMYVTILAVVLINRGTVEYLVRLLGMLK